MNPPSKVAIETARYLRRMGKPEQLYRIAAADGCSMLALFAALGDP